MSIKSMFTWFSKLDAESEVRLVDAETIPNRLEIVVDGTTDINLFPLHMVREMVEDYVTSGEVSNEKIANDCSTIG